MDFQTKPQPVRALRVYGSGSVAFDAGSWIVVSPDGWVDVVTDREFNVKYEPIVRATPHPTLSEPPAPLRQVGRRKAAAKPARATPATKKPKAGGSPLKADARERARVLITGGTSIAAAARELGIPYGTVYAWAKTNGWGNDA